MQLPIRNFRGQYRPQGIPRIDWNDSRTLGLARFWLVDGAGVPFDLVTGIRASLTGAVLPAANSAGPSGWFQGEVANTNYYTVGSGPILGGLPSWAVVAGVRMLPTTIALVDYAIYSERAASGNDILKFGLGSGGVTPQFWATYRNDSSTLINNGSGIAINDGLFHVHVMTLSAGSATVFGYTDGKQVFSNGWAASNSFTDAGISCRIASDIAGGSLSYFPDYINFVALYERPLTQIESLNLSKDPYGFLIFPEDEIFAEMIGKKLSSATFLPSASFAAAGRETDKGSATFSPSASFSVHSRRVLSSKAAFSPSAAFSAGGKSTIYRFPYSAPPIEYRVTDPTPIEYPIV